MTEEATAPAPLCWVVSDGRAGNETQGLGLARALGFDPTVKRLVIRAPWRWLPPAFWPAPLAAIGPAGDRLAAPWPDVAIGTGRLAVGPVRAIRRASGGRSFAIQILDPKVSPRAFDVVVAPAHDGLAGANVITTRGALNGLTQERLAEAAARLAPRVAHLPRPLVAVLVGGDSRVHRLTAELTRSLAAGLSRLAREEGAGLLVTPSRRTGPENTAILRQALAGLPAEIWDGKGDNPYLGYLALADAFVITADSVNMTCEAAFTGKPIHVAEVAGGTSKFARFHAALREAGVTRPFTGRLESWSYPPMNETAEVAAEIRRRMIERDPARFERLSPAAVG